MFWPANWVTELAVTTAVVLAPLRRSILSRERDMAAKRGAGTRRENLPDQLVKTPCLEAPSEERVGFPPEDGPGLATKG